MVTGFVSYQFRANSIYDPDLTGIGHQPRGRDQLALLYEKYCVIGSKITVRFSSRDNLYGIIVALDQSNDTAVPYLSFVDIMEQHTAFTKVLGKEASSSTLFRKYSAKKWFTGVKPLSDASLVTVYGGNPSRQVFWTLYAGTLAGGLDSGSVEAVVTIDYIVASLEPFPLGSS
jgi:hypothetical protein